MGPDTRPNRFEHLGVVHTHQAELLDVLLARIRQAVADGGPVLAILDPPTADALLPGLGEAAGRVELLAPQEVFRHPAQTAAERYLRRVHERTGSGRRLTILGQHQPVPAREEFWLQLEAMLNAVLRGRPVSMVCCYGSSGAGVARWSHPQLLVEGRPTPNPDYRPPADLLAAFPPGPPPDLGPATDRTSFDARGLAGLRRWLAERADRAGLSPERRDDLVLAVNEAASNSVEHGPGRGTLRIWVDDRVVTCEVRDAGQMALALPGLLPPAPQARRGRGLWTARQLCDEVHVWSDADGTGVRLTMLGEPSS